MGKVQFKTIVVPENDNHATRVAESILLAPKVDLRSLPIGGTLEEEYIEDEHGVPAFHVQIQEKLPEIPRGFLFAGRATIVAENNVGDVYTLRIGSVESEFPLHSGKKHTTYFLNIKAPGGKRWPNGSQSPWRYLGILNKGTGNVKATAKSEFRPGDKLFDAAVKVVRCVFEGRLLPAGFQIRHAGKCGKCGKPLTDPDSINRGIGSDCWEQLGRVI